MARGVRVVKPVSKDAVKKWMRLHASEYDNSTALGEAAADEYHQYEPNSIERFGSRYRPAEWIFEYALELIPTT